MKPNGILIAGLINPISFQLDEESLKLIYKQPFSDLHSLPTEKLEELKKNNEALVFGDSLTDQIRMDEFFPTFIAARAV